MTPRKASSQSVSRPFTVKSKHGALILAFSGALVAVLLYTLSGEPPSIAISSPSPATSRAPSAITLVDRSVTHEVHGEQDFTPLDGPADRSAATGLKQPAPTLPELESQFRSTYVTEEKKDIARLIAGWNDAQSVEVIARLFQHERHLDAREVLLVALGDVDATEGIEARLALLGTALQHQPRSIRTTALDLLDSVDDPRATKLIQQLMRNDPDREVRDAATAIYKARTRTAER